MLNAFPPSLADLRTQSDFLHVRGRTTMTRVEAMEKLPTGPPGADAGALMYLFHTGIGRGARVLKGDEEQKYRL